MRDPPSSSYPACIAVKCAGLQSPNAEENYLRMLREALMIKGENISRQETLFKIAESYAGIDAKFNMEQFQEDFKNDNGLDAFRKDLQEIQYHHINRFPTLVIRNEMKKGVMISGYRPYSLLIDAVQQISDLKDAKKIDLEKYKDHWHFVTERELQEVR